MKVIKYSSNQYENFNTMDVNGLIISRLCLCIPNFKHLCQLSYSILSTYVTVTDINKWEESSWYRIQSIPKHFRNSLLPLIFNLLVSFLNTFANSSARQSTWLTGDHWILAVIGPHFGNLLQKFASNVAKFTWTC